MFAHLWFPFPQSTDKLLSDFHVNSRAHRTASSYLLYSILCHHYYTLQYISIGVLNKKKYAKHNAKTQLPTEFGPRCLKGHGAYIFISLYLHLSLDISVSLSSPSISLSHLHLHLPLIQNGERIVYWHIKPPNNLYIFCGNGNALKKRRRQNQKINNSRPPVSRLIPSNSIFPTPLPYLSLFNTFNLIPHLIGWNCLMNV